MPIGTASLDLRQAGRRTVTEIGRRASCTEANPWTLTSKLKTPVTPPTSHEDLQACDGDRRSLRAGTRACRSRSPSSGFCRPSWGRGFASSSCALAAFESVSAPSSAAAFGSAVGDLPASRLIIGADCFINDGCRFDTTGEVVIGDDVYLGHDVAIITSSHEVGPPTRRAHGAIAASVTIGRGSWIGARSRHSPGCLRRPGCHRCGGSGGDEVRRRRRHGAGVPARVIRHLPAAAASEVAAFDDRQRSAFAGNERLQS